MRDTVSKDHYPQVARRPERTPALSRRIVAGAAAVLVLAACSNSGHDQNIPPSTSEPVPTASQAYIPTGSATLRPTDTAAPANDSKYPVHTVLATEFWIGESASDANTGIDNISTEWESDARKTLGGFDDPDKRGIHGLPLFKSKENPFYCAVPISEFDNNVPIPGVREHSPWATEAAKLPSDGTVSLLKGRWIELRPVHSPRKVYCQWLDTGPSNDETAVNDPAYVWQGDPHQPKSYPGIMKGVGIDVSPAVAFQLFGRSGQDASGPVQWRFVDDTNVPQGLWTQYPAIDNRTHWN